MIVIILILFAGCGGGQNEIRPICIANIHVIDPIEGLQQNMNVIIQNDRITQLVNAVTVDSSEFEVVLDGSGKYLIPGLWDAHVHFAFIEELAPAMFDLFLAYGVTSVRDTGGKLDFVKGWKNNAMDAPQDAPRVMISGPLLDGMPNVYDGSTPTRPSLSLGANDVQEAIKLVDRFDSVGVDFIKAYEMLTKEQFEAIASHAKSKGLKVTGHVPLSMDVITASNAGMNSMEHLRNLEMSCASNWEELLETRNRLLQDGGDLEGGVLRSNIHNAQRIEAIDNYDDRVADEVLKVLATNETWQIPTLSIMMGVTNRHFLKPGWKESFRYLPTVVKESWTEGAKRMENMPESPDREKYSSWLQMMTKKVHDAGIGIMAGTDCPIFYLTPGLSLHEELQLLVASGLSPLEAITTATLNPAKYFDIDDQLGLIREGYLADLVMLNENPLENIEHTKTIHVVIRNGKVRTRKDLDELLANLSNN